MAYKRHNSQLTLHGVDIDKINEKSSEKFFQAMHTASFDIRGDSSVYSMSLDYYNIKDDVFSHTPGSSTVTITEAGWYEVSYKVNHKYIGRGYGRRASKLKASVKVNQKEEAKSISWVAKDYNNKDSTNTWTGLIYLYAGDTIKVILQRFGGRRWRANTYDSVMSLRKL